MLSVNTWVINCSRELTDWCLLFLIKTFCKNKHYGCRYLICHISFWWMLFFILWAQVIYYNKGYRCGLLDLLFCSRLSEGKFLFRVLYHLNFIWIILDGYVIKSKKDRNWLMRDNFLYYGKISEDSCILNKENGADIKNCRLLDRSALLNYL